MFLPKSPTSDEHRIVRHHPEDESSKPRERTDDLQETAEGSEESTKEQAEGFLGEAERDSAEAKARIDKSKKIMQMEGGDETHESRDVLEQKIDALNERAKRLRASLPVEFLTQTTKGQIIDTLRFGISEDSRTYKCANFGYYREVFESSRLLKGFKVIREDRDGKVFAFDETHDLGEDGEIEAENRDDGLRLYHPINALEAMMRYQETAYSMDKIKEDQKYRQLFNERNRVRSVKGQMSETFVDAANPQEEFAEINSRAKQFQDELTQLLDRIPEVSKQTALLRLIGGSEVVVGRDGKMRMAFAAEHSPEFRALADKLFKGLADHVETDDEGRYAVEVAPESTAKLLARLELTFLFPTHAEDPTNDDSLDNLRKKFEIIESGVEVETPSVMNEHAQMLNARLEPYTANGDIYSDEAPAGKFLSGMQFGADDAGQLTFSHKSTDAVFRYFQQIEDSDTFDSSDKAFQSIRLKMKDGVFHSNDLSSDRAIKLIGSLQRKLNSSEDEVAKDRPHDGT